jgi:DNA segregation ATPase FtsK/SpoIIIE, S-DNA-T family
VSTRVVHRPARITGSVPQPAPLEIEAPPIQPEAQPIGGFQAVLPLAGAASSMTLMLVFRGSPLAGVGALAMVATVLATVALVVTQRGRATRVRRQHRIRYLDYLERLRAQFGDQERLARQQARALDPSPAALTDLVRDPARLWERRRPDPDFLTVRIGAGAIPGRQLVLRDQGTALQPTDPFMLAEARALVRRFADLPGAPLRVPLDRVGNVSIVGPREVALSAARALLLQVAALHAPDDVAVALCRPDDRAADWDWARWLPHLVDTEQRDTAGPLRRIATDPRMLTDLLSRELGRRASAAGPARRNTGGSGTDSARMMSRLLLFIDSHGEEAHSLQLPDRAATAASLGMTVVHLVEDRLQEPDEVSVRVTVASNSDIHEDLNDDVVIEDRRGESTIRLAGVLDPAPLGLAEGVARMLAPLRLSPESGDDGTGAPPADLIRLLELGDPRELDLTRLWAPRSERDQFRVPIGVDDAGSPVLLDLKEPALLGMGPHGLCVGATGSGKSELLRTLVLGLLLTHPPEQLSMVLVDYKGGATFAPFRDVPHVAGVITNLADDMALVERAHTSLAGEVQRRQQLLKDAGNVANIADYQLVRRARGDLPPLPQLLVIIDEFGELLTAKPEFIELFLSIGRIGRSIGVQLLLSSQRIEGGKLRGLDTYLSYRLGLRTFSEMESRTVLDTVDAFRLPPLPGFGYLKVDTSIYQRFKTAYVSGPYRDPTEEPPPISGPLVVAVPRPGQAEPLPVRRTEDPPEADAAAMPERTTGPTLLSVTVRQLEQAAEQVQQIWLPPLPGSVALDRIAGPLRATVDGLRLSPGGFLRAPVGLLDDPARQWQGRWDLDLTRAGGHAVIVGGPRSGRSTLLRTLVVGLALTHTPREVAIYGVDLLGGGLAGVADLPHVGGVAGRGDRERVRRIAETVRSMLDERERVFREHHIDSLEGLHSAHATGGVPELAATDAVLLIDGYGQLASEFEEVEPLVHELLARGSSYGLHVVASVSRWNEVRMAQQSAFGTRVELRLNEPADSLIDRKLAATIGHDLPGRALTDGRLLAHVALPRIDSLADPGTAGVGLAKAVRAIRGAWTGPSAPPVRVLPLRLDRAELPGTPGVVLGVEEKTFGPVTLDLFGRDPHLLVLGDAECGKTNLLHLVAQSLIEQYGPHELVFAVVDPRGTLDDTVPDKYLGGYAASVTQAGRLAEAVRVELARRMPDEPVQRYASGAAGPHVVLLVDDYDIVTAGGMQPLAGFTGYLAAGRDIGLHAVVTRRVAGSSRGLYEPFIMALRESGAVGLIMSGERAEGPLMGSVRATTQPPGRGVLVRAGEAPTTVQIALVEQLGGKVDGYDGGRP